MTSANAAATLERADDFAADFATATLTIKAGANVLVVHTLAGFVTSNSVDDALATANAIANETITGTGTQTADTVELTAVGKTYTLVIGVDITLSTTTYVNGETSSVTSLVITFPA